MDNIKQATTDNTCEPMQQDANTASTCVSEVTTERIFTGYLDERFSDLIINVAGQKIHAHKIILAAKCNYFERLLCPNGQPVQVNEINITDVSPAAFQLLLKYIYTGNPAVLSADADLMLEMLNWAHKNSYSEAKTVIIEKLQSSLDMTNISAITNSANNNDLKDLLEACFMFLDRHSSAILVSDIFQKFSQEAIVKLLERKSFVASEIDIFNALVKWSKVNGNINDCLMKNDRLSRLTVLELLTVVRSSNLVNSERLLDIITQKFIPNAQLTATERKDEEESITVYVKNIKDILRINDTNAWLVFKKCTLPVIVYHKLDDTDGLIFKLESPKKVNHIKMTLGVQDSENCYSYYIEVSLDEMKWKKVIDYTKYLCRADQELYFDEETLQYIRIVGTASDKDNVMNVSFFEALYKKTVPKIINGVIRPTENVFTQARTARFESQGRTSSPFSLFEINNGYCTYVRLNSNNNILIQLAQPYLISNIRLLMERFNTYKYFIETSVDKIDWEMAFDSRNEERDEWQTHHFTERPVVFIRITPTWASRGEDFYLSYFECPAAFPFSIVKPLGRKRQIKYRVKY